MMLEKSQIMKVYTGIIKSISINQIYLILSAFN